MICHLHHLLRYKGIRGMALLVWSGGKDTACADSPLRHKGRFQLAPMYPRLQQNANGHQSPDPTTICYCTLRGDIRKNWNDTEKISMAPAQG